MTAAFTVLLSRWLTIFVSLSGFFNGSDWSEDNRADTLIQHYPVYASAIPLSAPKLKKKPYF